MALGVHALCDVTELRDELEAPSGTVNTARYERLINRASAVIERFTRRRLRDRGTNIVELHSFPYPGPLYEMFTREYPITQVIDLREDAASVFGVATILDPAGYEVNFGDPEGVDRGKILRLWEIPWLTGRRVYQLTYRAGFASLAAVPDDLRDVAVQLAALLFRQIERKAQGEVVKTDATGATSRFTDRQMTTPHLSAEMKDQLQAYVRESYFETGERMA